MQKASSTVVQCSTPWNPKIATTVTYATTSTTTQITKSIVIQSAKTDSNWIITKQLLPNSTVIYCGQNNKNACGDTNTWLQTKVELCLVIPALDSYTNTTHYNI